MTPTTSAPPRRPVSRMSRIILATSHVTFALSFLLAMLTPTWRDGALARLPVLAVRLSGQNFRIGALALLPLIAACTWVAGRLPQKPGPKPRRWRWGPAYIALPVLGFGALVLARVWPIHIRHTAAVTVVSIAIFWCAYLYGLSEWPAGWATASMAALLAIQGAIGTLQFVKQGSIGLSWMGEQWLDPQLGEGMSVIAVAGRRWLRAYGLTPHPNALGGYLSMSLLISLGSLGRLTTRSRRWIGLCIALGSMGLLLTFSRSAWLGTLAGLIYLAGVTRPWRRVNWRSRRARRAATVAGGLLLVGAIAILLAFGNLLAARFFRLGDPLERRSLDDRIHDIREAWSLIRVVPLTGTGSGYYLGALWAGVGEERPPGFRHVHNVPLLAAAELGIPGALLWLWLLLAPPIAHARRDAARRTARPLETRAGWAAAFVSAFVLSMLDSYLYITSVWWAALFLGVLAGQWARGDVHKNARGAEMIAGRDVSAGRRVSAQDTYDEIGAGFGRAAARYDREVGTNPAMLHMRQVSLETLEAAFQPGQRVIEIGCGTGEEAVHLARRGIYVLATDLSPQMIAYTSRRAAGAGVHDRVQARRLAAGELSSLIEEFGQGSFDGAYSSFGPLNGEHDLRIVSASLAALIRPGGLLVASVMNRFYPLETIWYLAHGHPRRAVRRWKGSAMAGVSTTLPDVVPTWYYTPHAFTQAFAPAFHTISCRALPLLLPPPPLAHLWARIPGLLRALSVCEDWLAGRWPFCALGDHFLVVLARA